MIFTETPLAGAFIVDLERLQDERGFFAEGWKHSDAARHGITVNFNRNNISFNVSKGTLRGLHAQKAPFEEIKLVRCPRGSILDVIVDIRPNSKTLGQWFGVELSAENRRALYIPRGFLHGFQTLEEHTEVFYQVDGEYKPDTELGARFDDPLFRINWPDTDDRVISPKDQHWPDYILPVSTAQ
jgi:dTDP-4-dehydrorhamnose 3,5-epimerase